MADNGCYGKWRCLNNLPLYRQLDIAAAAASVWLSVSGFDWFCYRWRVFGIIGDVMNLSARGFPKAINERR